MEAKQAYLARIRQQKSLRRGDPEKAAASLREFTRQAWGIVEPKPFVPNWHVDAICEHLEACTNGQIRNLLVNIPPRCSKSLLVAVLWFCWSWIRRPETRWMFASYSQSLSTRDSLKCRNILQSDWYRFYWGDKFALANDQNQKTRFENDKNGFRLATSVGGMGTGEGGDFIVPDDPHNALEGESDAAREEVLDWWSRTMTTRGNDARTVCRVIVMQRLHEKDLSGWVLDQGGYEHLCLPMEFEPKRRCVTSLGFTDPRTVEGELLCEERFPPAEVTALKIGLGPYGTAGQLQQQPTPSKGVIFERTSFRYFGERALTADDMPGEKVGGGDCGDGPRTVFELGGIDGTVRRFFAWDCWWFQACDTATKIKQHNDYTVVGTFAVTPENDLLVYEMMRVKLEVPKQFDFLIEQRLKYPWVQFQAIEDASSGTGLIQTGAARGLPFRKLSAGADKVARATTVATLYQNGKVFHRRAPGSAALWLTEFESELLLFPRGAHDDQVDVTSYAGIVVTQSNERRWTTINRPILGAKSRPTHPEAPAGTTPETDGDKVDPVTALLRQIVAQDSEGE